MIWNRSSMRNGSRNCVIKLTYNEVIPLLVAVRAISR